MLQCVFPFCLEVSYSMFFAMAARPAVLLITSLMIGRGGVDC